MTTLFISDLHLDAERPQVTELFLRFLQDEARHADALYLLGDVFEAWVGDDDPSPLATAVAEGLSAVSAAGVPLKFMHGNRDFLLGADYARRCGMQLLSDPTVVSVYGRPTLLMHGDLLCTGDAAYQAFRAQTREPHWQAKFLAQPLPARIAFAQQARAASQAHQSGMDHTRGIAGITDVAADAVRDTLALYGIDTLIHGHTHRPAIHDLHVGTQPCRRIVLGDWYTQGSVLRADTDGFVLDQLALSH